MFVHRVRWDWGSLFTYGYSLPLTSVGQAPLNSVSSEALTFGLPCQPLNQPILANIFLRNFTQIPHSQYLITLDAWSFPHPPPSPGQCLSPWLSFREFPFGWFSQKPSHLMFLPSRFPSTPSLPWLEGPTFPCCNSIWFPSLPHCETPWQWSTYSLSLPWIKSALPFQHVSWMICS